jgi:hypothetical protein
MQVRVSKALLHFGALTAVIIGLHAPDVGPVEAARIQKSALGVDVDFYTGSISRDVWKRMKQAGVKFVVAQAWGGRSRNEFAVSQLSAARSIAGMKEAAYVLLNYDDQVCPTFANPVLDSHGRCAGDLASQGEPGGRWQVRQGLAALGSELSHVLFVAIDVEWFASAEPPVDAVAQARRRQYILDAIDELGQRHQRPVIYTRNVDGHWFHITGCDASSGEPGCKTLSSIIGSPRKPIPLWDVQTGTPDLANFRPYGAWTKRLGRQYELDKSKFGLPQERTVDLNVFDVSLFQ